MKKTLLLALILITILLGLKPKNAYQIFLAEKSKAVDFDKMMKGLRDADVVFFGEYHNNSICHWLQLQVLKELAASEEKKVIFGAEMFESDNQLIIDEYLKGYIREDHMVKEAKTWDNYETDYAPMVRFAEENGIPIIATNIPRRYASMVARLGLKSLDNLEESAKAYIAPLPLDVDYNLSSYKELSGMSGHGRGTNMVDAQAIKDATMAHFISENWTPNSVFYHINGSFHSKERQGIVHFVQQQKPDLKIATISIVYQEDLKKLEEENQRLADYVIAIAPDMTKTF